VTFLRLQRNPPAPGAVAGGQPQRIGLAMIVIMAGVLMTAVDTTIVVLALPEIERSLHVALTDVVWVIISFLLVITLLATQVGRLGDMFGRVRMYETGFAVFVVGSLLCALAWNELSIIVFRVVQGVGGALIMANSGAVIADLYPRERRGRAYGFTSLGWTVGAVLGIVLGGIALIGAFVAIEARVAAPMLPLRIFRVPTMAASLCASLFQGLSSYAVLFLVLMYLQGPRGLSPIHASLLLVPGYVVSAGVGLYAGRLADRRGAVLPATLGLALQALALICYAQLTISTPLWLIVVISLVNGVGASLFFPANSSAVMKAAPPDMFGIASGMLRTFANMGMVFSFAVAILVASKSISRGLAFAIFVGSTSLHGSVAAAFTNGLHAAFYESVAFMVIASVLSALRGKPAKGELQPAVPDAVDRVVGRRQAELARADLVQHHAGHADDRRGDIPERGRVGGIGHLRRDLGSLEDRREVGQLRREPAERVGRQLPQELTAGRVPAVELRVVVGAVEAARLAVHRFEQVDPPDRAADLDRHSRVDRPLEVAAVEHPQLEPDPVLGPFLSLVRVRVEEIDVADNDANLLEDEGLQHVTTPIALVNDPAADRAGRGRAASHYLPAGGGSSRSLAALIHRPCSLIHRASSSTAPCRRRRPRCPESRPGCGRTGRCTWERGRSRARPDSRGRRYRRGWRRRC
jgi:MFS family permease